MKNIQNWAIRFDEKWRNISNRLRLKFLAETRLRRIESCRWSEGRNWKSLSSIRSSGKRSQLWLTERTFFFRFQHSKMKNSDWFKKQRVWMIGFNNMKMLKMPSKYSFFDWQFCWTWTEELTVEFRSETNASDRDLTFDFHFCFVVLIDPSTICLSTWSRHIFSIEDFVSELLLDDNWFSEDSNWYFYSTSFYRLSVRTDTEEKHTIR